MDVEERITRIERILDEDQRLRKLERKSIRLAEVALLIAALAAPIIWAFFELASFLVNRFDSFRQTLSGVLP